MKVKYDIVIVQGDYLWAEPKHCVSGVGEHCINCCIFFLVSCDYSESTAALGSEVLKRMYL
jgi:hypothetical protein